MLLITIRSLLPAAFVPMVPSGHRIGTPAILFQPIEESKAAVWRAQFGGGQQAAQAQSATPTAAPAPAAQAKAAKKK